MCAHTGYCDQRKHGKNCKCQNGIHHCGHAAGCHVNCK